MNTDIDNIIYFA